MHQAPRENMSFAGIHLKQDGIKEALFEIRFETPVVPEAVIGRLTDAEVWADFAPIRMSSADIPQQLRMVDPNLRFAPSYELTRGGSNELIRIGPNCLSYHRLAPYPGWSQHFPELKKVVQTLFGKITELTPVRLGFRYVNALNGNEHLIFSASDLALKVAAGDGDDFTPTSFALNYRRQNQQSHVEQVQIATPDYVQPHIGSSDFSVLVDIDIFTPDSYPINGADNVASWIDTAHNLLKDNFFKLLPNNIIEQLRVK
jgi:uncharacterized protein (TIGR04255 family)